MASPMPTTPEPPYGIQEMSFPDEVISVMEDVEFAVNEISLSKEIPVTSITAHMNIVTKENKILFVMMSPSGFRIVGDQRDTKNIDDGDTYETIQALLDTHSLEYRRIFSEALSERLNALSNNDS